MWMCHPKFCTVVNLVVCSNVKCQHYIPVTRLGRQWRWQIEFAPWTRVTTHRDLKIDSTRTRGQVLVNNNVWGADWLSFPPSRLTSVQPQVMTTLQQLHSSKQQHGEHSCSLFAVCHHPRLLTYRDESITVKLINIINKFDFPLYFLCCSWSYFPA